MPMLEKQYDIILTNDTHVNNKINMKFKKIKLAKIPKNYPLIT